MTLKLFDGFDFGTTVVAATQQQMMNRGWTVVGATVQQATTQQRFGGKAVSGGASVALRADFAAMTAGVVGVALYFPVGSSVPFRLIEFYDGTTVQFGLGLDASFRVFFYRGTTATVVATGTTVLPQANWTYIEAKVLVHATAGTYECRLNGQSTPELIATTQDTNTTANNSFTGFGLWFNATAGAGQTYDDFYCLDTVGSPPHNDFLGEVRVQVLPPIGAGSSTTWTPLASTNWSNVDDSPTGIFDQDTTYNSSSTAGAIDLFSTQDLTGAPTIYAAQVGFDAKKDDAGVRNVRTKLKSGATTSNGVTQLLNSNYMAYKDTYLTDPNTGVAWTANGINAAEIGYENI